ncbi:MAG: hypothetical protein JSV62_14955 [Promethearchaeota archaeon]|nr:MAG: hypothetical protein JSV62_14955 [Candidatus Lokiarchaeota archaeon]
MSDPLKSKLKELEIKKKELQPKIDDVNQKREEEIQNVNKKYDHMIYDINYTAQQLEDEFYNDLIKSFVEIVTREFDRKRSSDIYEVSKEFMDYKESIGEFDMFPEELINRMHKVINGDPIEDIMYDLDKIQQKYLRS